MNKSYVYIILAAALWGTVGIFVNVLSALGFHTVQIAQLRAAVSFFFILVALLIHGKKLPKIGLSDIWIFLGTGIISYFIFNICYFYSLQRVGMTVAAALLYTSPFFVTVMSCIFFKERINSYKIAALLIAVSGSALVSGIGSLPLGSLPASGLAAGLFSGFTYALYSIFGVLALRKYNSLTVTFYTFLFASLFSLLCTNAQDTLALISTPQTFSIVLLLGLVTGAAPYFFYTKGLSGLEPSKAAILATVEPVVASVIGIAVFSERPTPLTVLGMALVILATVLTNLRHTKDKS